MSEIRLKFLGRVLTDYFGETIKILGGILLKKGEMKLSKLEEYLKEFSKEQIVDSLLVLQQHNLLLLGPLALAEAPREKEKAFSNKKFKFDSTEKTFMIDEKALEVFQIFHQFLILTEELFPGGYSVNIVEYLIMNGKATKQTLENNFSGKCEGLFSLKENSQDQENLRIRQLLNLDVDSKPDTDSSEILFEDALNKLLRNGFIEIIVEVSETNKNETEEMFRLNVNRFEREKIGRKMTNFVAEQKDGINALILNLMIKADNRQKQFRREKIYWDAPKGEELNDIDGKRTELGADRIVSILNESNETKREYKKSKVAACLMEMSERSQNPLLIKSTEGPNLYSINRKGILIEMKTAELQSSIKSKFGPSAARIFKLLTIKKYLEEIQISDISLIPRSEVRSDLFKLLRYNLVVLKEIPMNPNDPISNKMFYLWSVPLEDIFFDFLHGVLYKTWLVLKDREDEETKHLENYCEINQIKSGFEDEKVAKLERKIERVRISIGRLEDKISLFRAN